MQNRIEDLRNHLFATLEGLRDEEKPMDIDRAKAVAQVAQTIIESAKVEAEYVKRGHSLKSKFVELEEPAPFVPRLGNGSLEKKRSAT